MLNLPAVRSLLIPIFLIPGTQMHFPISALLFPIDVKGVSLFSLPEYCKTNSHVPVVAEAPQGCHKCCSSLDSLLLMCQRSSSSGRMQPEEWKSGTSRGFQLKHECSRQESILLQEPLSAWHRQPGRGWKWNQITASKARAALMHETRQNFKDHSHIQWQVCAAAAAVY